MPVRACPTGYCPLLSISISANLDCFWVYQAMSKGRQHLHLHACVKPNVLCIVLHSAMRLACVQVGICSAGHGNPGRECAAYFKSARGKSIKQSRVPGKDGRSKEEQCRHGAHRLPLFDCKHLGVRVTQCTPSVDSKTATVRALETC
jgi:hypothetical protein